MPSMIMSTSLALALDYLPALWDDPSFLSRFRLRSNPIANPETAPIPFGIDSRDDLVHVSTLFASLKNTIGQTAKRAILESKDGRAGLVVWRKWVTKYWNAKINAIVERVLVDNSLHPKYLIRTDGMSEFPVGSSYVTIAGASIAEELFGDVFLTNSRLVPNPMIDVIAGIGLCNWERIRKQYRRIERKYPAAKEDVKSEFELLENEKIKPHEAKRAVKSIMEFERMSQWFGAVDEDFQHNVDRLSALLKQEHKRHRKTVDRKTRSNRRVKNSDLATFADVADVWVMFQQHFTRDEASDDTLQLERSLEAGTESLLGSNDLGIDDFRHLSHEALDVLLGFPNGRPVMFNDTICTDPSVNHWDPQHAERFSGDHPDISPLKLLWHQKVGVAAMVDHFWSDDGNAETNKQTGIILADEVGIGKTAQCMAFIAFVIEMWNSSQGNVQNKCPTIVDAKPYFSHRDKHVPNLPHLIIVPSSLVDQWHRELKLFFRQRSVDIFLYPTAWAEMSRFWNPGSPFDKSEHGPCHRIIVMTQSALNTQVKHIFDCSATASKGLSKSDPRKPFRGSDKIISDTVFGREWNTVILDEAHEFRKAGKGLYGMFSLQRKARTWILATATPLYTSPTDIMSLLRIVGVPQISGPAGDLYEKEHNRQIQNEKRKLTTEEKYEGFAMRQGMFFGQEFDDLQDPQRRVRFFLLNSVIELKKVSTGCVIRRTLNSKKPDGTPINDKLPPYKDVVIGVRLSQWELQLLKVTVDELMKLGKNGCYTFEAQSFYIPYRTGIAYPTEKKEAKARKGKRSDAYPTFSDREDYKKNNKGSKLSVLVDMTMHILSDDRAGIVSFEDDNIIYPPLPEDTPRPQTKKILIYHEFPMMAHTIASALRVHNIKVRIVNGNMDPKKRDEEIKQFIQNDDDRVLLISCVASHGLNLTIVCVVILYDTTWSDVTKRQVIGRAWRLGQLLEVIVYHMVALQTTDVVMSSFARLKSEMLDAFVSIPENNKILAAIRGEIEMDEDDDVESEPEDPVPQEKRKGRPRKSTKSASTVSADVPTGLEAAQPTEQASTAGTSEYSRCGSSVIEISSDVSMSSEGFLPGGDDMVAALERVSVTVLEAPSSIDDDVEIIENRLQPPLRIGLSKTVRSARQSAEKETPKMTARMLEKRPMTSERLSPESQPTEPAHRYKARKPLERHETPSLTALFGVDYSSNAGDMDREEIWGVDGAQYDATPSLEASTSTKRPPSSPPSSSQRRPPKRFTSRPSQRDSSEGGYESEGTVGVIIPNRMPGSAILGLTNRRKAAMEKMSTAQKKR